jgi:high affinity sulfate transporter 1
VPVPVRVQVIGFGLRTGLDAVRRRDGAALRGDALAGITVAAYLVPQVMAYAGVAGVPAVVGLWAAAVALLAYAVLGSSRQLSSGPESTTALMTAIAVAPLAAGEPTRYAVLAAALALLVGAVCLLARVARLGFLAELLSRPVLVGYLAGIALVMVVGQLGNVSGVRTEGDSVVGEVVSFVGGLGAVHLPTLLLALAVLALLATLGRLFPRLPGPLVVVVLAAAATAALSLDALGVRTVGAVPSGLPAPTLPLISAADAAALVLPAIGVAIVAYSDDVLTARAFARDGERVDADRELLALGTANVTAGLVGGFPVSSSGSRTAIGAATGGRSQLSSVVSAAAVVAVLLVAGPLLSSFPAAALGALVVHAALRLVDVAEFRRFARFRRSELALALLTTVAVVGLGVLYGVLAAVGLSILDLLRKVSRPHDGVLGFVPGVAGMHDVADYPASTTVPGLVVYRYDAPLCFANAADFHRRALAALDTDPQPSWLLLNTEANVEIDVTAADALLALADELDRRHVVLALARTKQDLLADLRRAGLVDRIGAERIFPTLPTALAAYRAATGRGSDTPEATG